MNAGTAGHAGMPQLKQFHMVNIKMWKHPKYYKELRKRNKPAGTGGALCVDPEAGSDQVISANKLDGDMKVRAPGPGLKQQASSAKQQASSIKQTRTSSGSAGLKRQATSTPIRVTSVKHQATSSKLLDS